VPTLDLSIIVPVFNEDSRIEGTIRTIEEYAAERFGTHELIVVDDGSTDGTRLRLEGLARELTRLKVLSGERNRGKGHAVRRGVLASAGRLVLVTDADLATPIDDLKRLLTAVETGADVAIGSRGVPGSRIEVPQTRGRQWCGRLFNRLVQATLLPGIHDTQCGFKLFRGPVARQLAAAARVNGFAYDVEFLAVAARRSLQIAEVPVRWTHVAPSRVRPLRHGVRMLLDLLAMWAGLITSSYPGTDEQSPPEPASRQADVALVSLYHPEDGPVQGVASYTTALARALADLGLAVEVWSEAASASHRIQRDGVVTVLRRWRPGVRLATDLLPLLARRPRVVHAQIEYFIYGGWPGLASLAAFLAICRLLRKRVVVTLHHVVGLRDLSAAALRELGARLSPGAARIALRVSIRQLCRLTDEVIVHEDVFRSRLVEEYGVSPHRIVVVPHGVPEARRAPDAPPASRSILIFGYLQWYKGIDLALRGFEQLAAQHPQWRLVISGGPPPRRAHDTRAQQYVDHLRRLAVACGPQVELTGYVDDTRAEQLFAQADLVLFPYRALFASSGPLALAIAHHKPFVLSETLRPLLPHWPAWCENTPPGWTSKLRSLIEDEAARVTLAEAAVALAATRSWDAVARETAARYHAAGVQGSDLSWSQ
jgi:glycosyltransferase involved in cell wall biosynthesis